MSKLTKSLTTLCLSFIFVLFVSFVGYSQSSTATLSGTVEDTNGQVIPNAAVTISDLAKGFERRATTNSSGSFTFVLLPASTYTILVEQTGFGRAQLENIVLNVGDQKALQIQLKVGDVTAAIEVRGDSSLVRTDGSVGTVVNRQQVENMPLNGRSFQSLLELAPGVVITPASDNNQGGQFSVNGQRTNANVFTVDGVSANAGVNTINNTNAGISGSGQLPSLTASGTTASLATVDSLKEFRIQTSSYAAEFGRQPGGQVQLVTRSGENAYHGTAYDYVRNEVFDANDWFANRSGQPKAALRQHNFGGTFSGPLPFFNFGDGGGKLFHSGRDRTFFFFSYEGLRLVQPRTLDKAVPNLCVRGLSTACAAGEAPAHAAFLPYLNAMPLPNGPELGGGMARLTGNYSDPSQYDATAIRIDHNAGPVTLFGRFGYTPSYARQRGLSLSTLSGSDKNNTTFTAGATWMLSTKIVNDLRFNFTKTDGPSVYELDDFGGAVVPPMDSIFPGGRTPDDSWLLFTFISGSNISQLGVGHPGGFTQRQFNLVDNLTWTAGGHLLKFGVDFRRNNPLILATDRAQFVESLAVTRLSDLTAGRLLQYNVAYRGQMDISAAFDNWSVYAQDTWQATPRLTFTYGLRWEFVPPPHATEGPDPRTFVNLDDPLGGQVDYAAPGTPLWKARYLNFAPRFGVSYALVSRPGSETVIRAGGGIFYDLGLGNAANIFQQDFMGTKRVNGAQLPLTPANAAPPTSAYAPDSATPPALLQAIHPDVVLPRTYQWNVALERSLGRGQSISVSYVGSEGRELLKSENYRIKLVRWASSSGFTNFDVQRNLGYSDYRALQVQFQRRMSKGLMALASYTLGRSRDTSSNEANATSGAVPDELAPIDMSFGPSSFDIRHNFVSSVTCQLPSFKGGLWGTVARDWAIDTMVRFRTAFPLDVGQTVAGHILRPNVVPGQPLWIDDVNAPGERRVNLLAFSAPTGGRHGDLPRGAIRGFNARQVDVALRREFPLAEKMRLQLRVEGFNILNFANFGDPILRIGSTSTQQNFGAATQMLNRSLGGLSPLYQIGGPRSFQAAVRISF